MEVQYLYNSYCGATVPVPLLLWGYVIKNNTLTLFGFFFFNASQSVPTWVYTVQMNDKDKSEVPAFHPKSQEGHAVNVEGQPGTVQAQPESW